MQIDNVTRGDAVLIDYREVDGDENGISLLYFKFKLIEATAEFCFLHIRSGLNAAIDLHASTPTGEPLVHLAHDRTAQILYYSWSFAKINPWIDRFNQVPDNVFATTDGILVDQR